MGEILGTLCIVLAVVGYAAAARALGHELREFSERSRAETRAREQGDGPDAELMARELHMRYALSQLEGMGAVDLGGVVEGLGG